MDSPNDLMWEYGKIPSVENVNYDAMIFVWSDDYIGLAYPWGNHLNPLRWVDCCRCPRWGISRPETWWCWIKTGAYDRPEYVKTWLEMHPEGT